MELLPFINPTKDPNVVFQIIRNIDNFVHLIIGDINGGGAHSIWKKEGEKWQSLLTTQDAWECEIVMKENIPHDLVDNQCYYYKTQESWKYNTTLNKWEKQ